MRTLISVPNTDGTSTDYPKGRIRDKNTAVAPRVVGTPASELLYGDIVQFFHRLAYLGGIIENGLPDNITNGFQLVQALLNTVSDGTRLEIVLSGPWDMTATTNISFNSPIPFDKVVDAKVWIIDDTEAKKTNLEITNYTVAGSVNITDNAGSASIDMFRTGGGYYDSALFDRVDMDRAIIIIRYTD